MGFLPSENRLEFSLVANRVSAIALLLPSERVATLISCETVMKEMIRHTGESFRFWVTNTLPPHHYHHNHHHVPKRKLKLSQSWERA